MQPANNKNLGVYGIPEHSPFHISAALCELNITHRLVGFGGNLKEVVVAHEQPATVYLADNPFNLKLIQARSTTPFIIFLSMSEDAMGTTNCRILKGRALKTMLMTALIESHPQRVKEPFVFREEPKGLDDYVNEATKPTFLYYIQTAIYKLTPYSLVKEARTLIISALYGAIPMKKLYEFLGTSLKLEDLKNLLKDDKAKQVRELVHEAKRQLALGDTRREDEIVEKVVGASGLEAFDILYVIRSYKKMERDRISGVRRGRPPKKTANKRRA